MVYKVDFHPAAEFEFDEALYWYQTQLEGLEQRFFDNYLSVEKRLKENPLQFPVILEGIRRANLSDFPYSVFFEIVEDTIFIYAIFHQSRNPEEWKGRL